MTLSRLKRWCCGTLALAMTATGCMPARPFYFVSDHDLSHYKDNATDIEYPDVHTVTLPDVTGSSAPLTLNNAEPRELWDLTLEEAIQTALCNSRVIRSLGLAATVPTTLQGGNLFGDPNRLVATDGSLTSPTGGGIITMYDPAITDSSVTTYGTEAALSQFDAQLSGQINWLRNEFPQNFFIPGFGVRDFAQELGAGGVMISKATAGGGTVGVRNVTMYDQNNNPANLFPSAWITAMEVSASQHLLQGAGVQFNRINGPLVNNPGTSGQITQAWQGTNLTGGVPGAYRGVVLARINHDVSLATLEAAVRDMVNEVEIIYWRLAFNYRDLDAKVTGRDSALQTWRKVSAQFVTGTASAADEAQAREQYFLFRSQVEAALSNLYTSEGQLRYMMGIAPSDTRLIRPIDEPPTGAVHFDWSQVQMEALARSPELRKARWELKHAELRLLAAKNFLLPQLDAQALYRWRGFGNDLLNSTPQPGAFDNAWQTLTQGDYQEWQLGLVFNMPLGFRLAMSAVRNEELSIARLRAVVQEKELELSHQLANAVRNVDRYYALAQTNFNRRVAAQKQVDTMQTAYNVGTVTLDLVLDAQRRLAEAETAYFDSLSLYNISISQVHHRKNSLLEYNSVHLAEGPWVDKAYFDAYQRARERDAGLYLNYGFTRPNVLSQGPVEQYQGATTGIELAPERHDDRQLDGMPQIVPVPEPDNLPPIGTSTKVERRSPNHPAAALLTGGEMPAPAGQPMTWSGRGHETVANRPADRADWPAAVGPGAQRQPIGAGMRR